MKNTERNQWAFDGVMKWLTRPDAKRCVISEDNPDSMACVYYRPSDQNRCAIGGHLPLRLAKHLGDASIGIEGILMSEYEHDMNGEYEDVSTDVLDEIVEYYHGVDAELLDSLQRLHDNKKNWNVGESGLSAEGRIMAESIANWWGLVNNYG